MAVPAPLWPRRHVLHKVGAIGVMLSTLLFLVAFSVPAWVSQSGLWMTCSGTVCTFNVSNQPVAWVTAVRVIESFAMLAFSFCVLMEVLQDWFMDETASTYYLAITTEALAFTAGVLGITGAVVFGISWPTSFTYDLFYHQLTTPQYQAANHELNLQWGFALAITASITMFSSAAALVYSRCRLAPTIYSVTTRGQRGMTCLDEDDTPRYYQESADTSSMMLVPAGHFASKNISNTRDTDPPPYALPPPYPYAANCNFFLPVVNSSTTPQIVDASSNDNQATDGLNRSVPFSNDTEQAVVTPSQNFMSPVTSFYVTDRYPVTRPLFVKTDEGSEIEITPSAQNSSGLPSPFNHF